ncbi:MAG: universal stress protein [Nitrospirota bacterium]|jgi:nucleotide-binding universal stress UspA family protein
MKKVLVAVDDSKGSMKAIDAFVDVFSCNPPEEVVLFHTQKIEGRSLMDEMLGKAEMSTLKEELKGTDYQKELDRRTQAILDHFRKSLEDRGIKGIKSVVKEGHPAEEILNTAKEEGAGMIIVGSRGKRLHTLLMGSVSREVANRADVPVMLAK